MTPDPRPVLNRPTDEPPWQRQRLRVPREDGAVLARPPLRDAAGSAADNRALLEEADVDLQGRRLSVLRRRTQETVCAAAREYTAELVGHSLPVPEPGLVYVGGHQPTLFHPGVWVKNFALGALAARSGGVGLNLVVDNDLLGGARIAVPAGNRERPVLETLPFDAARPAQPWEEADILDRTLFASFGRRIADRMRAEWHIEPLAGDIWSDAVAAMHRRPHLADCLTAARHGQERRWGLENLELPIGRLCGLEPFLWFAAHLLAHLPRFRQVHNQVLHEYRRVNRVRSRTHPVPELRETGGWHEAPFWVWRVGDHRRNRLFARQQGREVVLSDGSREFLRLPLAPDQDACCAVERLRELPQHGIRLRTRALTTTLFARLCLADLFVHGIGGAKYDEMTDRIIARFFGLPAPTFLTLSASLHLPLAEPFPVAPEDEQRLLALLRELEYHPDRHVTRGVDAGTDALLEEKRRLIAEQQAADRGEPASATRRERHRAGAERFRRFHAANRRLASGLRDQRRRIEEELAAVRGRLHANSVLQSREFSFCLYPPETLERLLAAVRNV